VAVPILSLRSGDSPRLEGEDKAHVARLAEAEAELPPILVEQGMPLSQADRRVAAKRIVASHPQLSDRAIGQSTGLAAKTVAAIRRSAGTEQPSARVGRDGRVRPLDGAAGRRAAAAALTASPGASLRDVARCAGVLPATARDVRRRLERGQAPTLSPGRRGRPASDRGQSSGAPRPSQVASSALPAVQKLLRDPSLRHSEHGRQLLRLLQFNAAGTQDWPGVAAAIPPHCAPIIGRLARHYAQKWLDFAQELDQRARTTDPGVVTRYQGSRRRTATAARPRASAAQPPSTASPAQPDSGK
jgi:hypothetical protein